MVERSYDYPAHNALRDAWVAYQPRAPILEEDRMLYLAGIEHLELPGYLRQGYIPGQLLTCEHDRRRFPQVLANGRGVTVVDGNVIDAVRFIKEQSWPRLRGAWLDLDGNCHTYTEELMALASVLPGPRGSTLGVTSYAARDGEALVQGTVNASKFFSGLASMSQFTTQFGGQLRQYELLLAHIRNGEATALAHFQREMGLLWWLVLMFGSVDLHEGEKYYQVNEEFIAQSQAILAALTAQVTETLDKGDSATRWVMELNTDLRDMLMRRRVSVWITHLERYAFWSANRQPMRTWFAKVLPWNESGRGPTMQDLLTQVWNLSCRSPLIYIDEQGGTVTMSSTR
ncbi:MAG: hypothetical protein HQ488_01560 [Parcubacteria group bacterium]|nr:hypothetical protein [Parcubacteria group bacterium]